MLQYENIPSKCKCGWKFFLIDKPLSITCPGCGKRQTIYPHGLGWTLEQMLGPFGKLYKWLHRKLTGKDCGCEARRKKMNKEGWRGLFGKD